MLRNLFILLNVAFLASLKGLSDEGKAKISQTIPSNVLAGTEFIEEVEISKPATVNSFAKFEQQLPKGMVAVGLDLKGGVLTQDENNLVKIVWYKISDINNFTIKLRILVDYETSLNEYAISSRFAYLENNSRKSVESEMNKILVEKGEDQPLDENERELPKVADTTIHRALTDNIDKMLRESGVACTQVSEMLSMSEAKIDIRVVKGKVGGFAKIEEPVCEGVTAINLDAGGAVFTFVDGKVKYVWTNLPEGQKVTVSFKLVRNKDAAWMKRCTFEGEFSYLEGEKSMRCNFNSVTVDYEKGITLSNVVKPDPVLTQSSEKPINSTDQSKVENSDANKVAAEQNQKENSKTSTTDNTIAATNQSSKDNSQTSTSNDIKGVKNDGTMNNIQGAAASQDDNTNKQKQGNAAADNAKQDIEKTKTDAVVINKQAEDNNGTASKTNKIDAKKDIPNSNNTVANGGLVFKVQVCATHRTVDATFVKNNYKLTDDVIQEMHEGWFKFTVGTYGQYAEARNKREDLAPFNLPGPFVTAYNNGNRITVQEALMISKQQWVK